MTDLNPGAALSWPENHVFQRRFLRSHRTSSSKFSFVSPPNQSSKAVEVRGIHHRANLSFRAKVEKFGIGQKQGKLCRNFGRSLREF
ncbi:hypothetical protein Prudu_017370 [Prunus dulcis]|uniref:Uncharacterized protein n=1 Tax=Prunus dulcis TaxID=3755 RepID=A0A4Y1RNF1_PRUDU|nr:hypothetical protein Prudu_017370 [Prunus dulcis]